MGGDTVKGQMSENRDHPDCKRIAAMTGINDNVCVSSRGKNREKRVQKKWVLKSEMGHRWWTCLCSTFRFYDVWMLSKLLLGGRDHTHLVKFFSLLFSSCCEVLVIATSLLSCCYKTSQLKNSPSSKNSLWLKVKDILQVKVDKHNMTFTILTVLHPWSKKAVFDTGMDYWVSTLNFALSQVGYCINWN